MPPWLQQVPSSLAGRPRDSDMAGRGRRACPRGAGQALSASSRRSGLERRPAVAEIPQAAGLMPESRRRVAVTVRQRARLPRALN
eukprot:8551292-Alexandrium_andersonii.AAC.1